MINRRLISVAFHEPWPRSALVPTTNLPGTIVGMVRALPHFLGGCPGVGCVANAVRGSGRHMGAEKYLVQSAGSRAAREGRQRHRHLSAAKTLVPRPPPTPRPRSALPPRLFAARARTHAASLLHGISDIFLRASPVDLRSKNTYQRPNMGVKIFGEGEA